MTSFFAPGDLLRKYIASTKPSGPPCVPLERSRRSTISWKRVSSTGAETRTSGVPLTSNSGCESTGGEYRDRKSTRLNSSHVKISYAVFCLKKKTSKNIKTNACDYWRH